MRKSSGGTANKNRFKNLCKRLTFYLGQAKNFCLKFVKYIKNFTDKIPKKFVRVFIILLLSFFSVIIFVNREKFSPDYIGTFFADSFAEASFGPGFPHKINGSKVSCENFKVIDKDVVLLSDLSLTTLNSSASEMLQKQHSYQNPMLKTCSTRAIFYDLGGKNLEVTSKSKTLHTASTDYNIISAAISNYGTFAVVTEAKGFLAQLTVFSKDSKSVYYRYNFANHYITDVAISEDGRSAAVCGATARDGSVVSSVYVFDYNREEPWVKFDYSDNMFIRLEYLSNGNVVAVGDKLVSVINPYRGTHEDYSYDNKNIVGFDVNKKDGVLLALSLSEDGTNTDMVLIGQNGKLEKSFHTEHSVKAVSFNHHKSAALSYGKVYVYNFSGHLLNSFDVGVDTKNIRLFSGKELYTLGLTEVNKIRF